LDLCDTPRMTADDIDRYLAEVPEPARGTLEQLRRDVLAVVPNAEQCISYSVPAFKVNGKTVAGFAAFRHHLSYLPHSGSVLRALGAELAGYRGSTKSALHFPVDTPLPADLVRKLLDTRIRELDQR
jgi:uncharacterized protein YdhG (YjbR/CyaY superfamily)